MKLTQQQLDYFDVFGFLKLPGILKADIGVITEEFEKVLAVHEELAGKHDGTKRTMVGGCVDLSAKLSALLDDPRIIEICTSLLGEDFTYWGSDGNYYSGDTGWHPDGSEPKYLHIKIAYYLDKLDGSSGALRVIPGSHRENDMYSRDIKRTVPDSQKHLGIKGSDVPAYVLDVEPGDLLIFNHRTFHSSWGGSSRRRMFTMNLCQRYRDEDLGYFRKMIGGHIPVHITEYFAKPIKETAGPERMRHLEQMIHLVDWDSFTKHHSESS